MKNVLVVGSNGGMGRAVCKLLIEKGFSVFGLDFQGVAENGIDFFNVDLTNESSVVSAFEQIKQKTDNLFAIVFVSGVYDLDSLIEMKEEKFVHVFNVNLFGLFRVNKIFAPLLKKGSRVLITSSELAPLDPLPFTGVYAISKSAVEKYAFSLRHELNLLGVSVSVIRPGAVKTSLLNVSQKSLDDFCEKTTFFKVNAKKFKQIVDSVENKNVSPEKIANVVLKCLLSKKPKFVYNLNRNFLLRVLNALPSKLQVFIISKILKP